MSMSAINSLMEKAQSAKLKQSSRSRWGELFPVIDTLRCRGFSVAEAIKWLIDEEQVPREKRASLSSAYYNFQRRLAAKES